MEFKKNINPTGPGVPKAYLLQGRSDPFVVFSHKGGFHTLNRDGFVFKDWGTAPVTPFSVGDKAPGGLDVLEVFYEGDELTITF